MEAKNRIRMIALAVALDSSACLVVGYLAGKQSTPTEDRIVVQESAQRALAYVGTTSVKEKTKTETRWKVKTIRMATGQEETTTEVCRVEGKESEARKEESQVSKEKIETKKEETRTVNHVSESWRLAVRGGVDTVGRVAGIEVSRRMVGPLWLGAWVDGWRSRVGGGASLGVQW